MTLFGDFPHCVLPYPHCPPGPAMDSRKRVRPDSGGVCCQNDNVVNRDRDDSVMFRYGVAA